MLRIHLTAEDLLHTRFASAATVSGHTKTLRAAGLIVTARADKAVLHSVTPLGGRLLQSAAGSGPHRAPPGRAAGAQASRSGGGRTGLIRYPVR